MPRKEHNELKAGIFVLLAVAVGLGVVIWLGASSIFQKTHQKAVFYSLAADGPLHIVVGGDVK